MKPVRMKKREELGSWRKKKLRFRKKREAKLLDQRVNGLVNDESTAVANDDHVDIPSVDADESLPSCSTSPTRSRTVSLALPGSILSNAQSVELRTYLAGQIARAAAIFRVNEIVVFDEAARLTESQIAAFYANPAVIRTETPELSSNFTLVRILQYLETPQYLRKRLFPLQKELQYAGLLNPLDCPHHLRIDDLSILYREAVVLDKPVRQNHAKQRAFCDAGLSKEVTIDRNLQAGVRVTLKLDSTDLSRKRLKGHVVSPSEPRTEAGLYWGYDVRLAPSLSAVFSQNPYQLDGGYDVTVGTSDKGRPLTELKRNCFKRAKHILIVFGGLQGLEACVENDERIAGTDPAPLFDHYINTCPNQGSRTIRTEEAILISLTALQRHLRS